MKKETENLFSDIFLLLMVDNLRNSVVCYKNRINFIESLELLPQKKTVRKFRYYIIQGVR